MKQKGIHIIITGLTVFLQTIPLCGYPGSIKEKDPPARISSHSLEIPESDPEIPNEKYHLFTDRTMYAAGEIILFRALNLSPSAMKNPEWSRVLYLELLDASHAPVAQGKYRTGSEGSNGSLVIPANIRTGNYYLRGYTRWMRNFPAEEYASVGLVIINPHNPPVAPGRNSATSGSGRNPEEFNDYSNNEVQGDFSIRTDREVYPVRSKVMLEIVLPAESMPSACEYNVSVVPSLALESRAYHPLSPQNSTGSPGSTRFYPETRGITLSGRVMRNERQDPCEFTIVHSSILGQGSGYAGSRTNEQGKFHIVLPDHFGLLNVFMAAEERDGELLIDNDFSTDQSGTVAAFSLSDTEQELASKIMFGAEVMMSYDPEPEPAHTSSDTLAIEPGNAEPPFYGSPMKTIVIDDYVALPSLEEFIVELLPQINIRRRSGETTLFLTGFHKDLALYPTLILYDYVPVFNLDEFLRLTPEDMQRIEVVNATFSRGDLTFGGIVSVFSRNGDLSGYNLTGTTHFYDFEAYTTFKQPAWPDYSGGNGDLHIPDYRNTLFWEPSCSGDPGEAVKMEFFTPDRPGDYCIVVRGVSREGTIFKGKANFRVNSEGP